MNRILLFFACIAPFAAQAQSPEQASTSAMKAWQPVSIDLLVAGQTDRFQNMSLGTLQAMTKDPSNIDMSFEGFEATNYAEIYATNIELGISFSPLDRAAGTYRKDRELRIGLGVLGGKEAMVEYLREQADTSIVICNVHTEIAVSAAYIFKANSLGRVHPYWGLGAQVGATVDNETLVINNSLNSDPEFEPIMQDWPDDMKSYDAKALYFARAYMLAGIDVDLGSRWSMGLDARAGIGAQAARDTRINFLKFNNSFGLRAGYRF